MQVAYTRTIMPSALPPSPTLTNPDMILPYGTSSSSESSPETPRHPQPFDGFDSSPPIGSGPTRSEATEAKRRLKPAGQSLSPFRNGVLSRPGGPTRARSVTEREKDKGGDGRIRFENSRLSYKPGPEKPIGSSSALKDEYSANRVIIIEDDLQSDFAPDNTYHTPSILEEDEDDPNSHTAMSKRAEEILANAKKRLTNMEGNLNRARSTLGTRPSSSMSSFSTARNNEPTSLYSLPNTRINQNGFGHSKHHRITGSLDDSKPGRSRGFSDAAASPTDETTKDESPGTTITENSDPGRQWFWNGLTRTTSLANRHAAKGLQPLHEDGPAPQSFKRQAIEEEQDDEAEEDRGLDDLQQAASSNFATFDSENPPATGLTRARSTTQMRDIRDQMHDLKGKISTLKQRARQDSLYRRSLQNLRTPSPFTAAEQWYNGVPTHAERTSSASPNTNGTTPRGPTPAESPERTVQPATMEAGATNGHVKTNGLAKDDGSRVDVQGDSRPTTVIDPTLRQVESPAKPVKSVDRVRSQTPEAASKPLPASPPLAEESASIKATDAEDSLYADDDDDQAFHESSALPLGERHEDRPDAFDYEHFFLHSGMGHHKTGRSRSSSNSSMYSVETTKPADAADNDNDTLKTVKPHRSHHSSTTKTHTRNDSADSTTSFATATEEKAASDGEAVTTPKNVVIAPPRSDSLKHRKHSSHKTTRDAKRDRERERSSPKGSSSHHGNAATNGIRPPSNSFSSAHIYSTGIASPPPFPSTAEGETTLTALDPSSSSSLLTSSTTLQAYLSALLPPSKPKTKTQSISSSNSAILHLSARDTELAERLVLSLARVCRDLEVTEPGEEGEGRYRARMYRRKLDAARRVLDGEVNGEAF